MPAHNPETDSRTRTEHSDNNTSGCLKQLKSVALRHGPGARFFQCRNLWCFIVIAAYAPGGTHNVLNDPAITEDEWVITGIRPAPGTVVNASTPLTLSIKSA
jgi:hypothetical protein